MKSIIDRLKEEERQEFLQRPPLERMDIMHNLMLQFISLKAKGEGVTEYEIYCRYLKDNPRNYEHPVRSGRQNPPPEEEVNETPEEYLWQYIEGMFGDVVSKIALLPRLLIKHR